MNELLAGVYGTNGLEKTASEGGIHNLSDIAMYFASEATSGDDLEKVASAHGEILEHLVSFDRAGRAIAQQEFSQMEKAASEGDTQALEAFFSDYMEAAPEENNASESEMLREAVLAEIQRRTS